VFTISDFKLAIRKIKRFARFMTCLATDSEELYLGAHSHRQHLQLDHFGMNIEGLKTFAGRWRR
jgi:hypothetical protein